ncbi:MAG: flagellar hook capping protein [Lachnospiraceae bacterium]|nr:flagellar hook capping protein [Lachnospiraceae bacterium]
MAYTQVVSNGQLVDTSASATSTSSKTDSSSNTMDKDAFLQLLVAEMKYQDPLNPTANTEYVAQMATFSQLEATTNLESTVENQMANDLVGKEVILEVTDNSGNSSYVHGKVDYVMYEEGEVYLSVNDKLYSIDDLDTVVDNDYYEASNLANEFATLVSKLPSVSQLTLSDESAVAAARTAYDSMNDYQKGFVDQSYLTVLEKLEAKIAELKKQANASS